MILESSQSSCVHVYQCYQCLLLQKWFWQKKCATNGLHRGVKPGDTEMQPAILCNVFMPCAMRYDAKTLCNLHYDAMPHAMPSIPCVDLM